MLSFSSFFCTIQPGELVRNGVSSSSSQLTASSCCQIVMAAARNSSRGSASLLQISAKGTLPLLHPIVHLPEITTELVLPLAGLNSFLTSIRERDWVAPRLYEKRSSQHTGSSLPLLSFWENPRPRTSAIGFRIRGSGASKSKSAAELRGSNEGNS